MRKRTKTVIVILLILLFLAAGLSVSAWAFIRGRVHADGTSPMSFLVCGADDSGANTDVMAVLCADPATRRLSILQLPRDTLVRNKEGTPVKLNSRFAAYRAAGKSAQAAAIALRDEVSSLLSVRIDHVVILNMSTVASLVDDLGGLTVKLPMAMSYDDPAQALNIAVPAGERKLTGREAVGFLRYRSGYISGDLDRMDAQKLFFTALHKRVNDGKMNLSLAMRMGKTMSAGQAWTDMDLLDTAATGYRLMSACRGGDILMATMPGEALYVGNTWYYVTHRHAADLLLTTEFSGFYTGSGAIDPHEQLCDRNNRSITNAYNDQTGTYRVYTGADEDAISQSLNR